MIQIPWQTHLSVHSADEIDPLLCLARRFGTKVSNETGLLMDAVAADASRPVPRVLRELDG